MRLSVIEARDLSEAWWKLLRECLDNGYEYVISHGSSGTEGLKRKEIECAVIHITNPGIRPLVPEVPRGIPPPSTMEYVEHYLPYLLSSEKQPNEEYTYGECLEGQYQAVIEMYKTGGLETNQACMTVGSKDSIRLKDPQCLRIVDTRIRQGKLHWFVYFRSWDLWGGFPSNMAALQLAKEMMASEVGVEDGELVAFSKGLHLYDNVWELARIVARLDE